MNPTTPPIKPYRAHLLGLATGLCLLVPVQAHSAELSVDDMVNQLSQTSTTMTRSFKPTTAPDTQTNLCAGQMAPQAAPQPTPQAASQAAPPAVASASASAPPPRPGDTAVATRTLVVQATPVPVRPPAPAPVPYAAKGAAQLDLSLRFNLGSDKLSAPDKKLLDKLAQALNSPTLAEARFAVAGHTDATGAAELNLRLSCARALSARQHLLSRGVAAERLTAYGFGSARPLEDGSAGPDRSRRVEIRRAP